jgi:hypothetical protein
LRGRTGTFLAQSDTILFQAASRPFFAGEVRANGHFRQSHEKLSGRNEAASEACSLNAANGYASENDTFSFCTANQDSRKTSQCCLEKLCGRAIERRTTVSLHPERFHTIHWKIYGSWPLLVIDELIGLIYLKLRAC